MCMSGTSLGKLLAAVAAVATSAVFTVPGLLLAAGSALLLLCGLASGFGLAVSLTVGLFHFLVVSLCCNHLRLLLVPVSKIAGARGTSAPRGIVPCLLR